MLQAHTDEEFQTWVSAIQSGVTKAYRAAEKRHSVTEVSCHKCYEQSDTFTSHSTDFIPRKQWFSQHD